MGPKKALSCFFFTNTVVLPKTCEHRMDRDEVKYFLSDFTCDICDRIK